MQKTSGRTALILALFVGCRPHPSSSAPSSPSSSATPQSSSTRAGVPCGPLDCRQFDSIGEAFDSTLVGAPRIVAVGEAHAQKGTAVASSAKHFAQQILPMLAGRASDLLVELMDPPAGCAKTTAVVRDKQEVVTRQQAPSDQNEYVAMGVRARDLGIVPDLLRPTCTDLDAVKVAGDDAVPASLAMIARLMTKQAETLVDRDARTPADVDKFVVTYGGALHIDPSPPPDRAEWSFGPALSSYVGGRYVSVELYVPELIDDSDTWKARPFTRYYEVARLGAKTTVFHQGKSFVIVLPLGSAR